MIQRGIIALHFPIGSFAALEVHFLLRHLQLFHIHTSEPILITPKSGLIIAKGNVQLLPKWSSDEKQRKADLA